MRETVGLLRRTLARLEVTSRSLYAVIDRGSCFAGTLFELALAADRAYMLAADDEQAPVVVLNEANFGAYPSVNARTRLATRFAGQPQGPVPLGRAYRADEALEAGLVTLAPDELDGDDELRLALEERAALSPDALSGLEANLRFPAGETPETKIFGRLSAWQNWIFNRRTSTKAGSEP